MRYDQFMVLGWKILIPVSLAWTMVVAFVHSLIGPDDRDWITALIGLAIVAALIGWAALRARAPRPVPEPPTQQVPDGGFPVPPIPAKERADV